jgi:signal transduction histidine kinase
MNVKKENKQSHGNNGQRRRAEDSSNEKIYVSADVEARILTAVEEQKVELAECNKRLMEVSWSRADFVANMSKELRTPLHSIIGFTNVLQDQLVGSLNDQQMEYVNNILSSGKHLLLLINDILDLSKIESGQMELDLSIFSIRELLEDSIKMLRKKAHEGGNEINLNIGGGADVQIVADQRRLKQILFNLVSNAIKFSMAAGVVDVSAVLDGDFIEITVGDTGIGIKEEELPKIFHAFTQLEPAMSKKFEGIGLGLALSRQLVELHGGRIWVKSRFGTGSRFSFTVPLIQAISDKFNVINSNTGFTVLLIEEDQLALAALEIALKNKGYCVLKTGTCEKGIESAMRESPDFIVIDLILPGINGFNVAKRLRSEISIAHIPVLILTSMALSNDDIARLAGKVWRIAEKGSLSTNELIGIIENAVGPQ